MAWQGRAPGLQQAVQAKRATGPNLHARRAAEYIASLLEGLRQVANGGQMPFLAYLINVALEEANNEKTNRD